MISPQVDDIYESFISFKQTPSQGKNRPVVVLHILDNGKVVAAAAITSKNRNSHFSHLKLPIMNWRSKMTGLTSMSWVFVDDIRIIETKEFTKRLGRLHPLDFQRLLETIRML